jgi:hypothetical protein
MEIVLILFVGIVGGVAAGLVAIAIGWHRGDAIAAVASRRQPLDPPAINYSSLKVSGVGGLCLVALSIGLAIALPQIRNTMLTGLVLGILLAVALVLWRRRAPLPSSGAKPGANTTLAIDAESGADEHPVGYRSPDRHDRHALTSVGS